MPQEMRILSPVNPLAIKCQLYLEFEHKILLVEHLVLDLLFLPSLLAHHSYD
jgi:hypothetical protein